MTETTDVLRHARDTLGAAELGLRDLREGDRERRLPGLWNAVVFGRAVTNVLQKLRGLETTFDRWYAPHVARLEADPAARFLYRVRSQILKEGTAPTATMFHAKQLEVPRDLERCGPPPPGATHPFIAGDGVGWLVDVGGDTQEKYYVSLPESVGVVETFLVEPVRGLQNAVDVLEGYLEQLRALVEDAERQFGGAG